MMQKPASVRAVEEAARSPSRSPEGSPGAADTAESGSAPLAAAVAETTEAALAGGDGDGDDDSDGGVAPPTAADRSIALGNMDRRTLVRRLERAERRVADLEKEAAAVTALNDWLKF